MTDITAIDAQIRTVLKDHARLSKDAMTLDVNEDLYQAGMTSHAALFDDDEARRQIAAERKRVDDMKAQQQATDARIVKLEEALKSQGLLDLFTQLEAVKAEMNKLRGQMEVLGNNIDTTARLQTTAVGTQQVKLHLDPFVVGVGLGFRL